MDDPSGSTLFFLSLFSFCCSVLCSLVKSAYANFSPTKLEEFLKTDAAKQRLQAYLAKNEELLITTNVVGTLANIIFVISPILFFSRDGNIKTQTILYTLPLILLLLIISAVSIPVAIARKQPERIMAWAFPIMQIFSILLLWIIRPLVIVSRLLNKLVDERHSSTAAIEKEILQAVSEGQKEGVIQEEEKDMIEGIMDLPGLEAKEVMTPRTDVICIAIDTPIREALQKVIARGHSRIPVYKKDRDDIVGILYIKDLLKYWEDKERETLHLEQLIHKPYFIPEAKLVGPLLKEFREQKIHIAVVLDEYGGTSGIITIEDIIEEIVGEIADEHDPDTFEPIRIIDENNIEIDARIHVDELNEELKLNLPLDDSYETIGGFLFSHLGKIPVEGDSYTYKDLQFIVTRANERSINSIKLVKDAKEERKD